MTLITLKLKSPDERKEAQLAAELEHGKPLATVLKEYLRALRKRARANHPEAFTRESDVELTPFEKSIYRHLTEEGRRTVEDLVAEFELPRDRITAALDALVAAGIVYTRPRGRQPRQRGGALPNLYISREEDVA